MAQFLLSSFFSGAVAPSRAGALVFGEAVVRLRPARFRATMELMNNFDGLRVLALESRRSPELAKLITTYGGEPGVAPAMREVPLESNKEALAFAKALFADDFDGEVCI